MSDLRTVYPMVWLLCSSLWFLEFHLIGLDSGQKMHDRGWQGFLLQVFLSVIAGLIWPASLTVIVWGLGERMFGKYPQARQP